MSTLSELLGGGGGGGVWEYISTTTASAAATVDITGIDSTYDQYVIIAKNFSTPSTTWMYAQFFINGSLVTASTYNSVYEVANASSGVAYSGSANQSQGNFIFDYSGGSGESSSFTSYIFDPNTSGVSKKVQTSAFGGRPNTASFSRTTVSNTDTTGALTGIRMFSTSITGTFHLYGIKNS